MVLCYILNRHSMSTAAGGARYQRCVIVGPSEQKQRQAQMLFAKQWEMTVSTRSFSGDVI